MAFYPFPQEVKQRKTWEQIMSDKLKFGDTVINVAASQDNPIKIGSFLKYVGHGECEYVTEHGVHRTPTDNLIRGVSVDTDSKFHNLCELCWEALGINESQGKHIAEHITDLRLERELCYDTIRYLLPLAKGYVHANPGIKSTENIIEDAEAVVERSGK